MTNGGCTENSQCLCIELRGLVDGSGGSDAAEPSFHADHDLPGQHHWRLGRRGTFGCNGGSGHRDRDGGCAPTPWAGGTGPPENRLASTDVAAVREPIDEQYSAEPGLAVLDITGGDEDTVQAVMAPLEERWATSGAPPSTTSPRPAPALPSRPPGSLRARPPHRPSLPSVLRRNKRVLGNPGAGREETRMRNPTCQRGRAGSGRDRASREVAGRVGTGLLGRDSSPAGADRVRPDLDARVAGPPRLRSRLSYPPIRRRGGTRR
ncbi:DUF6207 family protein [Streptomyces flavotricini]|uniref:DUF6207 family protein n=1 Tax=Streptomyces flavotricini TaxID=66888 RepID=UPI001E546843|nr:DUF6207 family protein [Streptomyces flavotricini]